MLESGSHPCPAVWQSLTFSSVCQSALISLGLFHEYMGTQEAFDTFSSPRRSFYELWLFPGLAGVDRFSEGHMSGLMGEGLLLVCVLVSAVKH